MVHKGQLTKVLPLFHLNIWVVKRKVFLKVDVVYLVDSLFIASIAAHFLEDDEGARFDKVHPVSSISLQRQKSVSRTEQKLGC